VEIKDRKGVVIQQVRRRQSLGDNFVDGSKVTPKKSPLLSLGVVGFYPNQGEKQ